MAFVLQCNTYSFVERRTDDGGGDQVNEQNDERRHACSERLHVVRLAAVVEYQNLKSNYQKLHNWILFQAMPLLPRV